ncbi:general transcription and DNA repair factor IIH subunit TFB2-like [Malus sylvestris]|uniref:general transcription and DNA repair factor IIH subunit TFB2-like n=1 Tax=Malus sylvestris TaxID=3752 RepID=UPI0021AC2D56|nr:general transcription and DNA repair factor IIH subunit TFB2-like [Malus sylvestris]
MGMPTYSFSVQTSHLTSMAEEGFDFNACIYNGNLPLAMLVSPHLSFLAQEHGLDSANLISFLVELSFHVNGEAYNINTFNERQNNIVKDLALIKLQQGRKDSWFIPTNLATKLLVSLTDSSLRKQVGYLYSF